jgi:hypothetical protein
VNSGADRFATARLQLEDASRLLLNPTPEALEACRVRLCSAAAVLEQGRASWSRELAQATAAGEARLVRRTLLHVRRLFEKATKFHAGWHMLLAGAVCGEYRADGSLPELPCPRHVYLQGWAMANLLSTLGMTASALDAFTQVLQVTQTNVANASTPGYAKQTQTLDALPFDASKDDIGGVKAGVVLSSRDE